jgi:hypothetical protein
LEVLRQRDVTLLTLCYFFALTGGYGVAFWLPAIIERLSGQNNFNVTACVFAVSCRIPRAAVERLAFRSNLRAAMARGDPHHFLRRLPIAGGGIRFESNGLRWALHAGWSVLFRLPPVLLGGSDSSLD